MQKRKKSQDPLISIITVVLNGDKTLEDAFVSVLSQKFTDYEYIVIDGDSTDGTLAIIKKYEKYIDYWVSEADKGIYDAMNKAVEVAKGKWIYFLGADDVLLDSLTEISDCLLDDNTIYYGDVFRPSLGRVYDGRFSAYKLASRNICQQAIFYPKKVFVKYNFNLRYKVFADHEFNMRCWHDRNVVFSYQSLTIAIFNDTDGLSRAGQDELFFKDRNSLVKRFFPVKIYVLFLLRVIGIQMLQYTHLLSVAIAVNNSLKRKQKYSPYF